MHRSVLGPVVQDVNEEGRSAMRDVPPVADVLLPKPRMNVCMKSSSGGEEGHLINLDLASASQTHLIK